MYKLLTLLLVASAAIQDSWSNTLVFEEDTEDVSRDWLPGGTTMIGDYTGDLVGGGWGGDYQLEVEAASPKYW